MQRTYFIVFALIILQSSLKAKAQHNDALSTKKIQLQDLEKEQKQGALLHEDLKNLQFQETRSGINQKSDSQENDRFVMRRFLGQNVRPLEQKFSLQNPESDYASAPSNFNLNIRPSSHQISQNDLDDKTREGNLDADVISYSHDAVPFSHRYNRHHPQFELLSAGGAGYDLSSAEVLLPPFYAGYEHKSIEGHPLHQPPAGLYDRAVAVSQNRPSSPHAADEAANNLAGVETLKAPSYVLEYSDGYLPAPKLSPHRPLIQYGSPHASFRRPTFHAQSLQSIYAPVRSHDGFSVNKVSVPYPPSFVSITTDRPETRYGGEGLYAHVRPLGRSLGYGEFRASAYDPVPDFFTDRQSKSLLDSYIPSWVVARFIEQRTTSLPSHV